MPLAPIKERPFMETSANFSYYEACREEHSKFGAFNPTLGDTFGVAPFLPDMSAPE